MQTQNHKAIEWSQKEKDKLEHDQLYLKIGNLTWESYQQWVGLKNDVVNQKCKQSLHGEWCVLFNEKKY